MHDLLKGRFVTRQELAMSLNDTEALEGLLKEAEAHPAVKDGQCFRCGNVSPRQFAVIQPQPHFGINETRRYCLNCLNMGRMVEGETLYHLAEDGFTPHDRSLLGWDGQLSPEQARASKDMLASLSDLNRPHLIYAVTGSGKTEMIFPLIDHILQAGGRMGIASPRIDVCLELAPRLQRAFPRVKQALLYGGMPEPYVRTPLVISTTHQLLRFKAAFDALVIDEVDAFPYVDDPGLHFAVKRAVKSTGKLIYLTATPDRQLSQMIERDEVTVTTLPARYHRHPLPEPLFEWIGNWRQAITKRHTWSRLRRLIDDFCQLDGVKLLFMPSIRLAEALYLWLKEEYQGRMDVAHSKDPKRKDKVSALRQGAIDILITTTILERGVTFTNCHVLIIGSEDPLYSTSALVQMSGRVGRRPNYPDGVLMYAHFGISQSMRSAQQQIRNMNDLAYQMGLID